MGHCCWRITWAGAIVFECPTFVKHLKDDSHSTAIQFCLRATTSGQKSGWQTGAGSRPPKSSDLCRHLRSSSNSNSNSNSNNNNNNNHRLRLQEEKRRFAGRQKEVRRVGGRKEVCFAGKRKGFPRWRMVEILHITPFWMAETYRKAINKRKARLKLSTSCPNPPSLKLSFKVKDPNYEIEISYVQLVLTGHFTFQFEPFCKVGLICLIFLGARLCHFHPSKQYRIDQLSLLFWNSPHNNHQKFICDIPPNKTNIWTLKIMISQRTIFC